MKILKKINNIKFYIYIWNFFCNSIHIAFPFKQTTTIKFNNVQPNEIMFKIARSLNTPIIIKLLKIPKVNISISYIAYLTYFLYLIIVRIHIIKFETIVTIGNPIKKDHFLNPNIKSIKNNNINIWTVCKATLDARLIPFFKENIIVFHV